jgi:hypothetical protein
LWRELEVSRKNYRVDVFLVLSLSLGATLLALDVSLLALLRSLGRGFVCCSRVAYYAYTYCD